MEMTCGEKMLDGGFKRGLDFIILDGALWAFRIRGNKEEVKEFSLNAEKAIKWIGLPRTGQR